MRNSILTSIQAILIVFILSYTISATCVEKNPIKISGTVLCSDKHSVMTEGFVKIIVYNKNTNEINLIRIVTVSPEGKFKTGKIHLNTGDGIRIGAYANDVTWDHWDYIIINNYQQTDLLEIGAYANDVSWDHWDYIIINNYQQTDLLEIGAYANDVSWDHWDYIIINNNQQTDLLEIGAYANDVSWDHWDYIIINNYQQTDRLEIGAYANDVTWDSWDNIILTNNQDNMIEVDLKSDLDNLTIYAERKNNESDNGGIEFIGTYPRNPKLQQNYPNPFNPVTNINFSIAENTFVSIKVYDITGREIALLVNETKSPGNYSVIFDGSNLNSGFYFYQIIAGDYRETKKMSLLK